MTLLLRVRRTRPAPAYPDPLDRPPRSLALPPESELDHPFSLALLCGRPPYHGDLLARSPQPRLRHTGLVHPLNANARVLAACGGLGTPDHFPFARLVTESVSDLGLHWEDTSGARWLGRRHAREMRLHGLGLRALLLGLGTALSHGSRTLWRGRPDGPVREDRMACAESQLPPRSARRPPSGCPSRRSS